MDEQWLLNALGSPGENLLFHATLEEFEGRIRASDWEGVRWFADTPVVAQSYCPESGGSVLWATPRHRMHERFLPDENGPKAAIFAMMGYDTSTLEIERDARGAIISHRILEDHPTWNDAHRFVTETLGYDIQDETCWLRMRRGEIMPCSWRQKGWLYIVERPADLRLHDMRMEGEGGLGGRQWMMTDRFKALRDIQDLDGIIISDVHQSPKLGHFEHSSVGLFDRTLDRLRWKRVQCTHFDPADAWPHGASTPEFDELRMAFSC